MRVLMCLACIISSATPPLLTLASDLLSFSQLDLSRNSIGPESFTAICEAVQSNRQTKLASLNIAFNDIGPVGAKGVAAMVAITGSVTSIDVSSNSIDQATSLELIAAMKGKRMVSIGMTSCRLGVEGAKAMAELVLATPSMTSLDVSWNDMGPEGVNLLTNAVLSHSIPLRRGFKLEEEQEEEVEED